MRSQFEADPYSYLIDRKNVIDEYYKLKDKLDLTFEEQQIIQEKINVEC